MCEVRLHASKITTSGLFYSFVYSLLSPFGIVFLAPEDEAGFQESLTKNEQLAEAQQEVESSQEFADSPAGDTSGEDSKIDDQDEAHEVLSKIVQLFRPIGTKNISSEAIPSSVDSNAAISSQGPPSEPRTSTQYEGSSFEEKHVEEVLSPPSRPQQWSTSAVAADLKVAGNENEEFEGLPPPVSHDSSLRRSALPATASSGAVQMKNYVRLPDSEEVIALLPIDPHETKVEMLPEDGETEGASSAGDADFRQGVLSNLIFRLS